MPSTTCWISSLSASAALLLTGCASAPPTLPGAVNEAAVAHQTRDAHLTYADGFPGLRIDQAARERLDHALSTDDLADARATGDAFLLEAHAAALRIVPGELERLTAEERAEITAEFPGDVGSSPEELFARYRDRTDADLADFRGRLAAAGDLKAVRAVLRPVEQGLETPPAVAGRFGRWAPWFLFTVPSKIARHHLYEHEFRGDADYAFASATVYRPAAGAFTDPEATPRQAELLARFAPVVVQEAPAPDAGYDPSVDRPGRLVPDSESTVAVRPGEPAVYAFARDIVVDGRPLTQLAYVTWYTEQPPAPGKDSDPEAGPVDGNTFRITLDADDRPLAFETVDNCGCYHHFFPSARLEAAAKSEYGEPQRDRSLAIERRVRGSYDFIVPGQVEVPEAASRPVVRVAARWHGIIGIGFDLDEYAGEAHRDVTYELTPYAELEDTHTPDGHAASVFYDNGLVKNAQRGEGVYFTPAGMLSAGQSRQRGTQLIDWDDWDLDDPTLFTRALRWPTSW